MSIATTATATATATTLSGTDLTYDLIRTILERPALSNFMDEEECERNACQKLLKEFSDDDVKVMAETSYVYWLAATADSAVGAVNGNGAFVGSDFTLTAEHRANAALKEVRRHYVGENKHYDNALRSLCAMIKFRTNKRLDLLRTCMDPTHVYETEDDARLAATYRSYLEDEARRQSLVVWGKDATDGHAMVVMFGRRMAISSTESFVVAQWNVMERAIAATEISTLGSDDKIVAIFDFATFERRHAPTWEALKILVSSLQRHYTERLKSMIVLDAPRWIRILFDLMKPFLDADTKKKIRMVTGTTGRRECLGQIIVDNNATRPIVDMDRFIKTIPFHQTYKN